MPPETVCSCCGQEGCDGALYICTNCGERSCKTAIDRDFEMYKKQHLKRPNAHLYIYGSDSVWLCGPIEPLTSKNENMPEIEPQDPRYRWFE
jgi:hypothetical protein